MSRNEIFEKLQEVFCDVFDEEILINENTTAKDIEDWDSLMHITLINAIEEEFDMKFDMKDIVNMKNVGEMVDIIENEVE